MDATEKFRAKKQALLAQRHQQILDRLSQHRVASNHQFKETVNRFDTQDAALGRVEQRLEEAKLQREEMQRRLEGENQRRLEGAQDRNRNSVEATVERQNDRLIEVLRSELEKLELERSKDVRSLEDMRVWEEGRREGHRQEILAALRAREEELVALEKQRYEELRAFKRDQEEARVREEERRAREEEERRRFFSKAEETIEALSTAKLEVDNAQSKEVIQSLTNRLFGEAGPKTVSTAASTNDSSVPVDIDIRKENVAPGKPIEQVELERKIRALETDKRRDEREKESLHKEVLLERKRAEQAERLNRGRTRQEKVEGKKPSATRKSQRIQKQTEAHVAGTRKGYLASEHAKASTPFRN